MERLQVAVLAACVMSMVTGMLQLLRPNEKFDRQLRLLTAGMMLFSILIPLMQGISEIQPAWNFLEPQSVEEESSITEQVQEQLTTQIEQNLETEFASIVRNTWNCSNGFDRMCTYFRRATHRY